MTTTPHSHSPSESDDHQHAHPHADLEGESSSVMRIGRLAMFLEAHFGEVELHMPQAMDDDPELIEGDRDPSLLVNLDDADAQINLVTLVSLIDNLPLDLCTCAFVGMVTDTFPFGRL